MLNMILSKADYKFFILIMVVITGVSCWSTNIPVEHTNVWDTKYDDKHYAIVLSQGTLENGQYVFHISDIYPTQETHDKDMAKFANLALYKREVTLTDAIATEIQTAVENDQAVSGFTLVESLTKENDSYQSKKELTLTNPTILIIQGTYTLDNESNIITRYLHSNAVYFEP